MSIRFIRTAALTVLLTPIALMNAQAHPGHEHEETSSPIAEHRHHPCQRDHQQPQHRPGTGDSAGDCPSKQNGHNKT